MNFTLKYLTRISCRIKDKLKKEDKFVAELNYWKLSIQRWINWYDGALPEYCGRPSPLESEKVKYGFSKKDNAILTQLNIHCKPKYLSELKLNQSAFRNCRLLDIGSGPFPGALAFDNTDIYCLDPLHSKYIEIGVPFHYYDNVKFINAHAESMPFPDQYFDAVISVNAIDHVDDFYLVAAEVRRVIKTGGKMRMHIHYHPKTLVINNLEFEIARGAVETEHPTSASAGRFRDVSS